MITFYKPLWLLALIIIPAIWYWHKLNKEKQKKDLTKFSKIFTLKRATDKNKNNWRKNITFYLILATLTLAIVALADPYMPLKTSHKGVNVVIGIDVSGSMQEQDFSPNRLEAAKRNTVDLINQLEPTDLIGVVSFGQGSATTSYLTNLKERAIDKVKSINIQASQSFFGSCTGMGCETHIGVGLASAVDMASSIPNKKKVIVFLSDGANNGGAISPEEAISFAKQNDLKVFTIGMGKQKTDQFGRVLLDENLLKSIAAQTGGEYYNAVDDNTLGQIYESLTDKIQREKEPTSIKDFFIILALITSLATIYFEYGKYRILRPN